MVVSTLDNSTRTNKSNKQLEQSDSNKERISNVTNKETRYLAHTTLYILSIAIESKKNATASTPHVYRSVRHSSQCSSHPDQRHRTSIESMGSMDSMESFDSNGAPYGRGPASRKEQPFSVVMATRIALHSMDEVTRKKMPIDSRKNELRSCSTDRERSRFVLESRQFAFLRVLPCISDV